MKTYYLPVALCLLMTACGDSNSGRATATAPTFSESTQKADDEAKNVLHQMPTGEQIEEAYEAVLAKIGTDDDPELMEIYVGFSKSTTGPNGDDAYLSVEAVSPKDKNKLVSCRYDFNKQAARKPQEVTLSTGIGASEKFIDTYDGFKDALFKRADVLPFDKTDAAYEQAITKSGYGADKCYVTKWQAKRFPSNGLNTSIGVQSTRSQSASKSFAVDKDGSMALY